MSTYLKRWVSVLLCIVLLAMPMAALSEEIVPSAEATATPAPVTEAPVTEAPVTEAPTAEAPAVTDAVTTEIPTVEASVAGTEPSETPASTEQSAPTAAESSAATPAYALPATFASQPAGEIHHTDADANGMTLKAAITAAVQSTQPGDVLTWQAAAVGGTSPYHFSLAVYALAANDSYAAVASAEGASIQYTPTAPGNLVGVVCCTDASGNQSVVAAAAVAVTDPAAELTARVAEIAAACSPANATQAERALAAAEYLKANIAPDASPTAGTQADDALLHANAAQSGYARALALILDAMQIDNRLVETDDPLCAWNTANLDGSWYQIDVYADDYKHQPLKHFGLTAAAMRADHPAAKSDVPACTATAANYRVWKEGDLAIASDDALIDALASAIAANESILKLYNANGEGAALIAHAQEICALLAPACELQGEAEGCYVQLTLHAPEGGASDEVASADAVEAAPATDAQLFAMPAAPELMTMTLGVPVSEIRLSTETMDLLPGATGAVAAEVLPADAENPALNYASADPAVATVDAAGRIVAVAPGQTTITVSAVDGNGAQATLNVFVTTDAVESIAPANESLTLGLKESCSLAGFTLAPAWARGEVHYASSKTSVARVSADGIVTTRRTGSAVIRISAANGVYCDVRIKVVKAPSRVKISADRTKLGVGEETDVHATLTAKSASAVSFTSANPAVATVDANGHIVAVGAGQSVITARTFNGKTARGTITVLAAPTSLSFAADQIAIGAGDTSTFAAILPPDTTGAIAYTVSDAGILSVHPSTGQITGVSVGSTTVTATAFNGVSASYTVNVRPAPESISLSADHTTLGLKESLQLSSVVAPEALVGTLQYSSSRKSVVTVSASGVVTAKRTGSATITVRAYNGVSATIKFTVKRAPSSIKMNLSRTSVGVGESLPIALSFSSGSAGGYTLTSSDESIAAIGAGNTIVGIAPGTATITAQTYNGKRATAGFAVCAAPASIFFSTPALTIGAEQSGTLSAYVNEGAAGAITYAMADAAIASVDAATGKVRGLAAGVTQLTATAYNGVSTTANLTVLAAPTSVSFPASTIVIGLKDSLTLTPIVPEGCAAGFSFSSSKTRYVKVNGSGVITALRKGTAKITVKTYNGKKATLTVKVVNAPSSIALDVNSLALGMGEEYRLSSKLSGGMQASLSYSSANEAVATVDASGLVHAVAAGETVITARSYNGKTADCTVLVGSAPTSLALAGPAQIAVGQQAQFSAQLSANSIAQIAYTSDNPAVATVDAAGIVCGVAPGTATISAGTYVAGISDALTVQVLPAPDSLSLGETQYTLAIDQTLQLTPVIPEGTLTQYTWVSGNPACVTVDQNGLVTPVSRGTAQVKVSTHNGLSAIATITVYDPYFPDSVTITNPITSINVGETYTPEITVFPESSQAGLVWSSSNDRIATVDPVSGIVTGVNYGRVTISASSTRNPDLHISYVLLVLSGDEDARTLVMPARRTSTAEISTNLARINAVEDSAYRELEHHYAIGTISSSEYERRHSIIANAFAMYAFPWMTLSTQKYWRAANSENGAKNFQPGTVYYGLPYINSPWDNRLYNVSKAVNQNCYYDSGSGYYILNQSKLLRGMYCGNDCSAFVSAAIWGTGTSRSDDTTRSIATASYYKTLKDWTDLRPGDLINRSSAHVVMFLYYANAEHTEIVTIEQGGCEAAINTVSTNIYTTSYYSDQGYSIRRMKDFA